MKRATIIARRELGSYFCSALAYVAMAIFLAVAGMTFFGDFVPGEPVTMRTILKNMVWALIVIVPLLSMGSIAQELATGTIETLMTAPVRETDVVLGKFAGTLGFLLVILVPTLLYIGLLRMYGQPDYGSILTGYLGIVLVGAMYTAVSLFCSALTRSQMVAAISAAAILFLTTVAPWYISTNNTISPTWQKVTDHGVYARYADFSRGVLDTSNVVYFVLITGLFLFVTVKVMESRRWR